MLFSKDVGLLLMNEEERILVREEVRARGLEPIDIVCPLESNTTEASQASLGRQLLGQPRVVIADASCPTQQSCDSIAGNSLGNSLSLIIVVRDEATEDHAVNTETDANPWELRRPLRAEDVREKLRAAIHASRVFGERSSFLCEELHLAWRILDSMSNGVTISDANSEDHALVYVNPAFERMTGYPASESCGRNSRFLQGPDSNRTEVARIREAVHEQRGIRALLRNYKKDGTPFWNELYLSPMFDANAHLTHFVGFQNDVTARVEGELRLQYLSQHDALTGLANRAIFMDRLKEALSRSRRNGSITAVFFLDLNNFKQVNDCLGHEAGDGLLQEVAKRLNAATRTGEMAARIGGDEFVVVLEGLFSEQQARQALQRLKFKLEQPCELNGVQVYPSASIGLAMSPDDGDTPASLLRAADAAMYRVKSNFHLADRNGAEAAMKPSDENGDYPMCSDYPECSHSTGSSGDLY
jgi:diguanylate cyclase (GGDEF)-like protein/PAS domain S-box-containing protein